METFYKVDSNSLYSGAVILDKFSAIVNGSYTPPPDVLEGEAARLSPAGWHVVTAAELAEIKRKAAVPASVTPRQIRQALTRAGYRGAVETTIAAGSQDLKDWYEFADEFLRNHPLVQELLGALGLTEKDADDVWTLAGLL